MPKNCLLRPSDDDDDCDVDDEVNDKGNGDDGDDYDGGNGEINIRRLCQPPSSSLRLTTPIHWLDHLIVLCESVTTELMELL